MLYVAHDENIYLSLLRLDCLCNAMIHTFIRTDSLNFSLFIILMATRLPRTQCTPSLTRPDGRRVMLIIIIYILIDCCIGWDPYPSVLSPMFSPNDRDRHTEKFHLFQYYLSAFLDKIQYSIKHTSYRKNGKLCVMIIKWQNFPFTI